MLAKPKFLIFYFLFFAGIIFRLWFITLYPQPQLIADQYVYNWYADGILKYGIFAVSDRLYGYPLILAVIKIFFGNNYLAVHLFQAILDTLTAFMIYFMGSQLFKSKIPSYLALITYLFNPFTSAYVGMLSTEITAIFLTLLIYILFQQVLLKGKIFVILLVSLLLGFLPQLRPSFVLFPVIFILVLFFLLREKIRISQLLLVFTIPILFILPFIYTAIGNIKYFNQFSFLTVDKLIAREFYFSMLVGKYPHHTPLEMLPKKMQEIYYEFTPIPRNKDERKAMADKYINLGLIELKNDLSGQIIRHFKKMYYVWEKNYLFYYTGLIKPISRIVYIGNSILLFLGIYGFIYYWRREAIYLQKYKNLKVYLIMIAFLWVYISVIHMISTADERYSLPGYPLMFLFAGYAIYKITTYRKKEN
ncbi:hypothetical protein A2W14_04995 [Candidatus Gottesmanbacteria bacterium RBG_16_37_8]|uniref:Glycosyltransferase RgtA/B/C/D-like domain-containing protein n=1 Tax=Candidatus Gottesmanbacteria bacterium RBG_16_37_8 TaxID=1798371 RepID=A0A1F5YUI0_9BACT|nr:MAG: hypothetical protein A2W14_04995 [Candidatus Gottesmanbacteria bacterium RBG_16_37_8]